ncbi:MAG: FGGY family carbohydrate kinase, partial [Zestosphaera sp.]
MIVAVDVGTSSVKAGLVSPGGRLVRSYVKPIPLSTPAQLAAEHDLELMWRLVLEGVVRVSRGYEGKVEAISLGTYLHALGVLDERFRVVVNVMTYLDRRCHAEQKEIEERGFELYRRTGCPPIFVFPLCKALWLRRQGLLRSSHKLTFLKDYLVYKLTGRHAVDYGVASGTGFLNVRDLRWEPLALEAGAVDEDMLPQLVEGAKVYERVDVRDARLTDVAVVPGSFDGALQNIGYGVFSPDAVLNLGSTTVVRALTQDLVIDREPEARFFTYYAADGYRVVGGASNNGMAVVKWFKSIFRGGRSLRGGIMCRDGVYVLPFAAGERYPFRDPDLTFTFTGLRLEHKHEDLVKALFEG